MFSPSSGYIRCLCQQQFCLRPRQVLERPGWLMCCHEISVVYVSCLVTQDSDGWRDLHCLGDDDRDDNKKKKKKRSWCWCWWWCCCWWCYLHCCCCCWWWWWWCCCCRLRRILMKLLMFLRKPGYVQFLQGQSDGALVWFLAVSGQSVFVIWFSEALLPLQVWIQ